jgi:hypothetical protein
MNAIVTLSNGRTVIYILYVEIFIHFLGPSVYQNRVYLYVLIKVKILVF